MNLKEKTVVIDNKTYHYSKIVMLPTEKATWPNCIWLGRVSGQLHLDRSYNNKPKSINPIDNSMLPQHLYFLSNDKICEGDWVLNGTRIEKVIEITNKHEYIVTESGTYLKEDLFKIISSTNSECNLPKPSNSFLQVYIDAYNKNEKIEECCVEYNNSYQKIQEGLKGFPEDDIYWWKYIPKTTKGEITIRKVKESLKELCKKDPELRKEIIEFAAKYARKVQEDNILNGWKPMHNNKWIEENL